MADVVRRIMVELRVDEAVPIREIEDSIRYALEVDSEFVTAMHLISVLPYQSLHDELEQLRRERRDHEEAVVATVQKRHR